MFTRFFTSQNFSWVALACCKLNSHLKGTKILISEYIKLENERKKFPSCSADKASKRKTKKTNRNNLKSESISVCSVICFSFSSYWECNLCRFFFNFILNTFVIYRAVVRPRYVDTENYDGFVNWNSAPASFGRAEPVSVSPWANGIYLCGRAIYREVKTRNNTKYSILIFEVTPSSSGF